MISKIARTEVWLVGSALVCQLVLARGQEARPGRRAMVAESPRSTNAVSTAKLLPDLPPLPEGVADLKFEDFFKTPVGARGLELTEKIKGLDGKRVRICGFMVREEVEKDGQGDERVLGRFMVTALPASVSIGHYGLADDLPPQTLFVTAPEFKDRAIQYMRGPMLLTGILSVGNRAEPDGRFGAVRLTLDAAKENLPKDQAAAVGAGGSLDGKQTTQQVQNP